MPPSKISYSQSSEARPSALREDRAEHGFIGLAACILPFRQEKLKDRKNQVLSVEDAMKRLRESVEVAFAAEERLAALFKQEELLT